MPTLTKCYSFPGNVYIEDRAVAKKHEAWLELVALCRPIVADLEIEADEGYHSITLALHIVAHGDHLQRILRAKPTKYEPGPGVVKAEPNGTP